MVVLLRDALYIVQKHPDKSAAVVFRVTVNMACIRRKWHIDLGRSLGLVWKIPVSLTVHVRFAAHVIGSFVTLQAAG